MKDNDKLMINMNFNILNNEYVEFTISNNFNPKATQDIINGIGNENAKRRLNLLFSNNYVLESKIKDDNYKLFLKIPVQ